jgi:hypothetical protein
MTRSTQWLFNRMDSQRNWNRATSGSWTRTSKISGSVDRDKLLVLVNQRVSDGRVLGLIKQILEAGCVAAGKRLTTEDGVPHGGLWKAFLNELLCIRAVSFP